MSQLRKLADLAADGYPATVAHAFAAWEKTLRNAGFDIRRDVWGFETWAQWIGICRHYKFIPQRIDALEHRIESAKMRGLTAEQFHAELQAEKDADEEQRAKDQFHARVQALPTQPVPIRKYGQRRAVAGFYGDDDAV